MHTGNCLCGKIRIEVSGEFELQPEACHCTKCRKQSGHFGAAVNVRKDALTVHGAENVAWYQTSEQVKRGFCPNCGSNLFWQPVMEGYGHTAIFMGVFDEPTGLKLVKHTFVAEKGDYYEIDDGVPQADGF